MAETVKDTPQVLDDLRQKRLAYFESGSSAQHTQNEAGSIQTALVIDDKPLNHPIIPVNASSINLHGGTKKGDENGVTKVCAHEERPLQDISHEYLSAEGQKIATTDGLDSQKRDTMHHIGESLNKSKASTIYQPEPLRTSSFYLSGPHRNDNQVLENDRKDIEQSRVALKPSPQTSVPIIKDVTRETGESNVMLQEDGYNETVERLIRATKEELLGLTSTDDIWTNLRKTSIPTLDNSTDQAETQKAASTQNKEINEHQKNEYKSFQQRWRSNSESCTNEFLSSSMSNIHDAEKSKKPKLFSQTSVPVGVTHHGMDIHPIQGKLEPHLTRHLKPKQETQKSLNTNTVEELFNSKQQVAQSAAVQNGNVWGSQDFEVSVPSLPVHQQSLDFSDLGLSTHRPESERKDVEMDADDLNLGDTVSQELRTLLGEEKFQQFLLKSKQDLDDLHQDKTSDVSDRSVRRDKTPRLLKDRPTLPKKPNTPVSDRQPLKSNTNVLNKKPTNQKDTVQTNSNSKSNTTRKSESRENAAKSSQEFTPRIPDSEAVNSLIGKYVINQPSEATKYSSNPAHKATIKVQELKEEHKMLSPKTVPGLNLEALQDDSPRPKLNRPKYEPHTIYSEKQKAEHSDRDSFSNSSEGKPSPGRNYEQVTVPRNVAFSASEIYHQAYGVHFISETANSQMSSSMHSRGPQHMQFTGSHFSTPLTPKTPSGSTPMAEAAGYGHYYNVQGQMYQPASGMTYQGMPLTPVTPQEAGLQMFASRDEESFRKPYIASTQLRTIATENFQVDNNHSSNQPNAHGHYSQMYGMMPDPRGHPPHSGRMDPLIGVAPPVRMATPAGMVQPKAMPTPTGMISSTNVMATSYPVNMGQSAGMASSYSMAPPTITTPKLSGPVTSLNQSMHFPHPPAPTTISQQFTQPSVTTVFSSPQGMPMAYPYPFPVMMMAPHPPPPHPPADPPVTSSTVLLETPKMSNAEVQTETAVEKPVLDDKVTLVEESTFTSVSQIKVDDEDVIVPHPPSTKKGLRSSPRKPPTVIQPKKGQQTKRHIEGIRQHHEQRRQQQEEEKMSEEQTLEKQRRFAKQSLERYFSSLENLYMASSKASKTDSLEALQKADVEREVEVHETYPDTDRTKDDDGLVDDVISETNEPKGNQFNFVVPGFMDFTEFQPGPVMEKKESFKFNIGDSPNIGRSGMIENEAAESVDCDTVVNSEVTGVSIKAGGLTDRLREIGVDVHSNTHQKENLNGTSKTAEMVEKKQEGKRGKVLIVCPECQGLNKEYMSWCTHCGEIIIGVEPMLVSKNREGKIRMKPVEKSEVQVANDLHISVEGGEDSKPDIPVLFKESEDEEVEKPFTLNLDVIKSPKTDSGETNNASPSKSDGRDSGRPSSDDNDLLNYKIEQEVVNDICETITDPVLKGYVKSHFAKKSHAVLDKNKYKIQMHEGLLSTSEFREQDIVLARIEPEKVEDYKAAEKLDCDIFRENIHASGTVNKVKDSVSFTVEATRDARHKSVEPVDNIGTSAYKEEKKDAHHIKTEANVHELIAQFDRNTHLHLHSDNRVPVNATSASYEQKVISSNKDDLFHEREVHESNMDRVSDNRTAFGSDKQITACDFGNANKDGDNLPVPPPIPNFSASLPVSKTDKDELRIKIPLNSMDFSEDFSQAGSVVFDSKNAEEIKKAEKKKLEREERRQERRRNRGHGAIDVEVFGYEETRDCRNSSRGLQLVPILNLAGNSSDEDDMSIQSDAKPEVKAGTSTKLDTGYQPGNAWEPVRHDTVYQFQTVKEELQEMGPAGDATMSGSIQDFHQENSNQIAPDMNTEPLLVGEEFMLRNLAEPAADNDNWRQLYQPDYPEIEDIPDDPDDTDIPGLDHPFLDQVVNQPELKKSKQQPKATKSKRIVKSKVRKSVEEPGYQRRWARSSTAWSSYNQGELNTTSSLQSSGDFSHGRPSSASRVRSSDSSSPTRARSGKPVRPLSADVYKRSSSDSSRSRPVSATREQPSNNTGPNTPTQVLPKKPTRPLSADLFKRKQSKQKKSRKEPVEPDSDRVSEMIEHRLPRPGGLDRLIERMASPGSTYDRYIQMTPRIEDGTLSRWQCLPDEILLHIFAYLDQTTLTQCAQVCNQFYRVAMDESLWKYITIKKKADLDDNCLMEIAKRHPVSLALIQCYGDQVSAKGLRDLFRECADSLKELNVGRCSRGTLHGDSILLHAAARCHKITHLDTSWCNVTDSGLMAIGNCCNRLESLCISGCQAVSNDGLETVVRKHGPYLRVLEMFGCINIAPRGLRCIANNCINLISLNLGQCYKLTDSCIAQLSSSLGRVETLDLRGLKQIKDNCIRRVVKNCTRLKHLSLANCPGISDVSVLEVATYLTDIRSVDFCGCKNITDNSIRALVNTCTNLRHIDISSTGCTHRSVSMIANFCGQRLESLKINFLSDVTEQSLIKLAKHCLRLESVHMYGCTSIRNMDKITNERPSFSIEM